MAFDPSLPTLDHELAEDELTLIRSARADFAAARAANPAAPPKEALRQILAQEKHWPGPQAPDLSGPGPWRLGRNRHGRGVAAVFLPYVELHTHAKSRTDQFPIYTIGATQGFSLGDAGTPILTEVTPDSHFHNAPGVPHAFLPTPGAPRPENWEIAFLAITPRNLQEDTQAVTEEVRATYQQATGSKAPRGV